MSNVLRIDPYGSDIEISVVEGFLAVDIATQELERSLVFPGPDAIPKIRIRINEDAIQTTADGGWAPTR